jgi:hypothetical protein
MGLTALSTILADEQRLLELLLLKLEAQRMLIGGGRERWLTHASDELEVTLEDLRHTERRRTELVSGAAADLGLADTAGLADVATAAPAQVAAEIRARTDLLHELGQRVRDRRQQNREALRRSGELVRSAPRPVLPR